MLLFSRPILKAHPDKGIQLIIPVSSNHFIRKFDQFFLTENNIFPCVPEKVKCIINENFQFDLYGTEVIIATFPNAPKALAEATLNYMITS